jgi:hypothetical protein
VITMLPYQLHPRHLPPFTLPQLHLSYAKFAFATITTKTIMVHKVHSGVNYVMEPSEH